MQLSVDHIKKQYSTVLAVKDLSFKVNAGEIFALLGPNGAGKSSTIRMLVGLTKADAGSINYSNQLGVTKNALDTTEFGYLPEERGLFQESTILNTLVYMARLKGMEKQDALKQADEWLERFDLSDRKKDPLKTLSKGNQQKVQLISSIIHRPAIAFLDEPFSGLDPVNQEKVIEFLRTLQDKGTTIILSAHQMSLVEKLADRFLLMDKGEATLYGSIQEIREHTQLGASLTVTFSESVCIESFSFDQGIAGIDKISDKVIKFSLTPTCHVPTLLQKMLTAHQIESLQTQQASLHDIYLNSVKDKSNG